LPLLRSIEAYVFGKSDNFVLGGPRPRQQYMAHASWAEVIALDATP
jgi:hypothetical protein